jgi:hypothetical protein
MILAVLTAIIMMIPASAYRHFPSRFMRHSTELLISQPKSDPTNMPRRTCKACKQQYQASNEGTCEEVCSFHPGIFSGRLNRINDIDTSDLEYFWSCCGAYELESRGCIQRSRHTSYDDEGVTYSILTGKPISYK